MSFKKIRYNTGENIIKIKIQDETGRFIENWTLLMSDLPQWVEIISRKYGIRFSKIPRDLFWAT